MTKNNMEEDNIILDASTAYNIQQKHMRYNVFNNIRLAAENGMSYVMIDKELLSNDIINELLKLKYDVKIDDNDSYPLVKVSWKLI